MQPTYSPPMYGQPVAQFSKPKSWFTTLVLALFLGWLGVHRFYTGKVVTGILMLLTFGGFGIWNLIDVIMILAGGFKDSKQQPLVRVA